MEITKIEFRLVAGQIDLGGIGRNQHARRVSNRLVQMPMGEPDPGDCQQKKKLFHKILEFPEAALVLATCHPERSRLPRRSLMRRREGIPPRKLYDNFYGIPRLRSG